MLDEKQIEFIETAIEWLKIIRFSSGRYNVHVFKEVYKDKCETLGKYEITRIFPALRSILTEKIYTENQRFMLNTLREFYIYNIYSK